jgi:hypothetical protein
MDFVNQLKSNEDMIVIGVKIVLLAMIAFPPKKIVGAIANHKKSMGKMIAMLLAVVLLAYCATKKLDSEVALLIVILAIVLIKGKVITYEMMKGGEPLLGEVDQKEDQLKEDQLKEGEYYKKSFRDDFYPSYVHMNDIPFKERLGQDYLPYDSCQDKVLLKK